MVERKAALGAGVVGLFSLVFGAFPACPSPPAKRLIPVQLSAWLASPQKEGELFIADRPVTIKAMTEVTFSPRQVPGIREGMPAHNKYVLAAFAAAEGHRLLLAPAALTSALPQLSLAGAVVRPEALGIPHEPLAELGAALPKVDTRLVTAFLWTQTPASQTQASH